MKSVLVVLGTRPEVIKLAPVIHALRARPEAVHLRVCSTAQHREMLDDALSAFEIVPDLDLALMTENQALGGLFGRMATALDSVVTEEDPDVVVVQGDTLTVMAAAVTSFLNGAKVAHVEAGLRTADKREPFPEEVSRRIAGVVADYHFAPTEDARDALLREGVAPETVRISGNTGIDALFWMKERLAERPVADSFDLDGRRMVLVTAHRRESFGEPLREVFRALRELVGRFPDIQLVYPVHLNPNVRGPAREILGGHDRITLLDPLPYPALASLLIRSELVITDSGGLQEEAPSIGKPVLVLREKTERPEAVRAGTARLVGTDGDRILSAATELLGDREAYEAMSRPMLLYGDGRAAPRIVEDLVDGERKLADFTPSEG